MDLKSKIIEQKLPKHIAIIMDGNGRWAKQQGEDRIFGHHSGVTAVRESVEACAELGINYLTLYAFSTENWNRPKEEVNALMELLVNTISGETANLQKNNIKLTAIGDLNSLPENCKKSLEKSIKETENNQRLTLILALSYSSKWEILKAINEIANEVSQGNIKPDTIDEEIFRKHLCTANIPDPELMIRTSGEHRISNFLLWQLAYAEFYFTEKLWPDFKRDDLYKAIIDFQNRERRFGKTSEQILI
jgi:undecaprenyl diphosphate synthase